MIGVDDLIKIIRIALASSSIAGERPLSVLLIASVGSGKTQMLSKFAFVDGVYYCTDSTPYALHHKHGEELKNGKIKHIIIPDLLNIVNKPKEQATAFITFLNSMIEEGLATIESRNSDFKIKIPVNIGLITSVAIQDFMKHREKWATVGFLSRLLPVRFRYSQETITDILDSIVTRDYRHEEFEKEELPGKTEIYLPVSIGMRIKKLAWKLKDPDDETGGRKLKQLNTFAMAHALLTGRAMVTLDDLHELIKLSVFMKPPQIYKIKDRYNKNIEVENVESYEAL